MARRPPSIPLDRLQPFLKPATTRWLRDLERQLAPDRLTPGLGMTYGDQSKYVQWTIPRSLGDPIYVIQLTDLQFGHSLCNYRRVLEYRDWLLAAPNRFCVFTGDMVDAWALWSPGSPFEQLGDPQSQVFRFIETWAPARHRILGYVGGNHERRALPGFGDLGTLLATLLRIPYSSGRQFLDLYYGRHQPFKIVLWHGTGGARTKGTVAQVLDRFMREGDGQLYLMGHLHQPLILPMWKEFRDHARRQIEVRKCVGAVGSSFLETFNTYSEIRGYPASDVLMPCAQIEASGRWQVNLR